MYSRNLNNHSPPAQNRLFKRHILNYPHFQCFIHLINEILAPKNGFLHQRNEI